MHCLGLQNTFPKKKNVAIQIIHNFSNCCPIVEMCHGRGLNNKINNIHEREFKILEYLQKTKTLKITFFLGQSFAIGLK